MLFVSVSGTPAANKVVLPYVFHVQERKYKGHPDGKLIDFASDSDNNTANTRNGIRNILKNVLIPSTPHTIIGNNPDN